MSEKTSKVARREVVHALGSLPGDILRVILTLVVPDVGETAGMEAESDTKSNAKANLALCSRQFRDLYGEKATIICIAQRDAQNALQREHQFHPSSFSAKSKEFVGLAEPSSLLGDGGDARLFANQPHFNRVDTLPVANSTISTWLETPTPDRISFQLRAFGLAQSATQKKYHLKKVFFFILKRWDDLEDCGYTFDHLRDAAVSLQRFWVNNALESHSFVAYLNRMTIPRFGNISEIITFVGPVLHHNGEQTVIPASYSDTLLCSMAEVLAPAVYQAAEEDDGDMVLWYTNVNRETEFEQPLP